MDTQNDGLEKVDSFKIWPFLVSMISMLDFSGVHTLRVAFQMVVVVVVVVVVVPSDPSFARIFSHVVPNGNLVFMCILYTGCGFSCMWRRGLF